MCPGSDVTGISISPDGSMSLPPGTADSITSIQITAGGIRLTVLGILQPIPVPLIAVGCA